MKFTPIKQKTCELCGELFWPESRNQRCCKKDHFRKCPICGAPVRVKYKSDRFRCCSKECSLELKKRNNLEKWGVDNPAKSEIIKEKQAQTCMERYGAATPFQMGSFAEKSKATSIEKYGVEYPMQSESVKAKHIETCMKRHGVATPTEIDHVRSAQLDVYNDPIRLRAAASKRTLSRKHTAFDGTVLDSSYELAVYEYCLKHNLRVTRQIPIQFSCNGSNHTTLVDFRIEGQLVECKGGHLLSGCYREENNGGVSIINKIQTYKEHDVVLVTDSQSSRVLKDAGLLGIDISFFMNNIDSTWDMIESCIENRESGYIEYHPN